MFDSVNGGESAQQTGREPSLYGGYSVLYENKIPVDIRYIDYDRKVKHLGSDEYISGTKANASKLKLEVDSDYDPFFNIIFECDQRKYEHLKEQQELSMDFQEFPTLLIKCFNKVEENIKDTQSATTNYTGKLNVGLLVGSDGKAKLTITQTSQYKNVPVIILDLSPENQDNLEQKVSYRYGKIKGKVAQTAERLAKIQQIIRLKNPTLLAQIYKSTVNKLNLSDI